MSQPFKLYRLQQIDSQLDQTHSRLHQIEVILSENEVLHQAQARSQESERLLQAAQKSLHKAEAEVRQVDTKIEQSEASLYGGKIHNPKELQDLQKEIESLKRQHITLEDRQLDCMVALEEAESQQESAVSDLQTVQEQVNQQQSALVEERDKLQKDVSRMEQERQATRSTIEPEDLRLYDQLRQQKRGVAVAGVSEKACAACGTTLTPAQIQSARSPSQLFRCGFCGRIVYSG